MPRVLVVDDEPRIAQSLMRLFKRSIRLVAETDGASTLQRLVHDRDFDVILCDLTMQGMSGVQLFQELQRLYPSLARRVVFSTGGTFGPGTKAFLDSVGNPVVEKPFDDLQLWALMCEVVRRTGGQPVDGSGA